MDFLVTGGAGFIGSNIVEELLKQGHTVRVIDNFSTGRRENLESVTGNQVLRTKNFDFVEGDIRNLDLLRSVMSGSRSSSTSTLTSSGPVDFVLHQAALPSVPRSIEDPATTHEVNATGTLNVLLAARDCGVKRVVYASSSSVYGDSEELPKHEGMAPNPLSPYAISKLAGEHYCRVFSRLFGLETVALRYFNIFGPRQDPKGEYAAVIPKFIAAIRAGRQPTVFGDGEQSRDFTPVANAVAANIAACNVPLAGQVKAKAQVESDQDLASNSTSAFLLSNVAVGERYTLNFLVSEICRIMGKRVEPVYDKPRPGDVRHSQASVALLTERVGIRRFTTFQAGLEQLVNSQTTNQKP
ncbi:MAG: NAD-dependent epimerase/dehydratase family protein [candidate division WOR-3 bacterium]|nr:MAG: NAD-dependent epimerase/dehydratase family protein [candidate division WOR-3 bacterium]